MSAAKSLYYDESHDAFRETVRRFVDKEIAPFVDEWDEASGFPRELYKKAADVGILGLGYPEEYGGSPCDQFHRIVLSQELARSGAGGVSASLMSHTIGSPPILAVGPQAMKERVLPQVLSGEKISALAITEPSGGSDVAQLKTTARREGDHYIVNGSKMFITSGVRADFYTVAVRTGGPGASGVHPRKLGSVVGSGLDSRFGVPSPLALVVPSGHGHGFVPFAHGLSTFTRLSVRRHWAPSAQPTSPPGSWMPAVPLKTRSAVKLLATVSTARGSNSHCVSSLEFSLPGT